MRRILFILFFAVFSIETSAQTFQQIADSLEQLLSNDMLCNQEVDLFNEISYAYRRVDPNKTFDYAKKALSKARKCGYIKGEAIANKNIGIVHIKILSPPDSAISYNKKAILLAEQCKDYYTMAACNNNLAISYRRKKKLYTSIQHYLQGVEIFETYFDEDQRLKALLLSNVGESYYYLGQYQKALHYIERGLDMAKKNNYPTILSIFAEDHGKILINLGRYDEARTVLEAGINKNIELGDFASKALTLNILAELEIKTGHFEKARAYANQSISISSGSVSSDATTDSKLCLAEIELHNNHFDKAIEYCNYAIDQANKNGNLNIEQKAKKILSQCYVKKGDYKIAFEIFQEYTAANEAIFTEEKLMITDELQGKYRISKMENDIAFLNKEKNLRDQYIYWLVTFFAISVFAIFYILFLLRNNKKTNTLVKEKNKELKKYIDYNLQLENFAYIASHDMKTPLRTIVSFSQLLKRKIKGTLDQSAQEYLDFIISSTKEMSLLLNDLLNYSNINKEKLIAQDIEVDTFVNDIIKRNQSYLLEKNAKIELDLDSKTITGDRTKLGQVLQNLILNAVKFHKPDEQPMLYISSKVKNENVLFTVKDNGIGIEDSYYNKIFMIFKKLNKKEEYQGSGIGLAICKKAVELHGGKIWVESAYGEGSTFYFTIPCNMN